MQDILFLFTIGRARDAHRKRDYELAIKRLSRPSNVGRWEGVRQAFLGRLLLESRKDATAIAQLDNAIKLAENNADWEYRGYIIQYCNYLKCVFVGCPELEQIKERVRQQPSSPLIRSTLRVFY